VLMRSLSSPRAVASSRGSWRYRFVQKSLDFLGVQTRLPHTHIDFINSMTIAIPLMSKILSYSLRNGLFYNARITFLNVVFRILDGLSRRHNSTRLPHGPPHLSPPKTGQPRSIIALRVSPVERRFLCDSVVYSPGCH
jgi:hypothetical protein